MYFLFFFVARHHIFLSDATRICICCYVCTQVVFSYYCYYFSISTYMYVSQSVCQSVRVACTSLCSQILKFIAAILLKMLVIIVYPYSAPSPPLSPSLVLHWLCLFTVALYSHRHIVQRIYLSSHTHTYTYSDTDTDTLIHTHVSHSHVFIFLYLWQSILL